MLTKDEVHRAVVANNDKSIKVRMHQGDVLQDKVYRGVFKKDVLAKLGKEDIKYAINMGWLEETQIRVNAKTRQTVYLWPFQEMSSCSWNKIIIFKIKKFFNDLICNHFGRD